MHEWPFIGFGAVSYLLVGVSVGDSSWRYSDLSALSIGTLGFRAWLGLACLGLFGV